MQPIHPIVLADDIEPGMVLAESVHDAQGRLLIPAGTALTERHLRAFQLWGIQSVQIAGGSASEAPPRPPISPETLREAQEQVRARFRHNDLSHVLMAALFTASTLREARRIAGGGPGDA
jgi:hypothetical protein